MFCLKRIDIGFRGILWDNGEIRSRHFISSLGISRGMELQRIIMVAASSGAMDILLSLVIVSS